MACSACGKNRAARAAASSPLPVGKRQRVGFKPQSRTPKVQPQPQQSDIVPAPVVNPDPTIPPYIPIKESEKDTGSSTAGVVTSDNV